MGNAITLKQQKRPEFSLKILNKIYFCNTTELYYQLPINFIFKTRLLYTQKIIHHLGVFQGHDLVLYYACISSHPFLTLSSVVVSSGK